MKKQLYIYLPTGNNEVMYAEKPTDIADWHHRATMYGIPTQEPLKRYEEEHILIGDVIESEDTKERYKITGEVGYEEGEEVYEILIDFGDNDFRATAIAFGNFILSLLDHDHYSNIAKDFTKQKLITLWNMSIPTMYLAGQRMADFKRCYDKNINGFHLSENWFNKDGTPTDQCFNYLKINCRDLHINGAIAFEIKRNGGWDNNSEALYIDLVSRKITIY